MTETKTIENPTAEDTKYIPESKLCQSVDTVVPPSMRYELRKALETVGRRVNGVDAYVAMKLGYTGAWCNADESAKGLRCLCEAYGAEQVDALALAIYNIEEKGQGCIIADQTGVGKGRIAAGMIRYAVFNKLKPVFLTAKANLFTDIYRDIIDTRKGDNEIPAPYDLMTGYKEVAKPVKKSEEDGDIGEEDGEDEEKDLGKVTRPSYKRNPDRKTQNIGKEFIKPFIVNAENRDTDVKDLEGHVLFRANMNDDHKEVIQSANLDNYDCVFATYSQFQTKGDTPKKRLLQESTRGSIVIMDESHKAAGDSAVGEFFKETLGLAKGVTYLSATFAKRPDNMPVYALKTAMSDVAMNTEKLVEAIEKGGEALQEILSSQLVSEQQLVRRERSFEGVEVNWWMLDDSQTDIGRSELNYAARHRAMSDAATDLLREVLAWEKDFTAPFISELNEDLSGRYEEAQELKGRKELGITHSPMFSVIFNFIYNLLFAIKAEATANIAIRRLKEGKAVMVVFSRTMESFVDNLTNDDGSPVKAGDIISTDFSYIGKVMMNKTLEYKVKTPESPTALPSYIKAENMSEPMRIEYNRILAKITELATGINFSPIDVLRTRIEAAGYSVEELTGRSRRLRLLDEHTAILESRTKASITETVRLFQNNKLNCILMNQAAATGASMHATLQGTQLKRDELRQRAMVIQQPELDINIEIQKRGRINRVGQHLKPIYDYVVSAVPSEMRLMFMLRKKLRSLDANTTSSQATSQKVLDVDDFLNKIGDRIVFEYLEKNVEFNEKIGDPAKLLGDGDPEKINIAHKATGRVAILPVQEQEAFYEQIMENYAGEVSYLKQIGEYDLEVQIFDLEAKTLERQIAVVGTGGKSVFGRNSILEKCEVNILKKPLKASEIQVEINSLLEGKKPETYLEKIRTKLDAHLQTRMADATKEVEDRENAKIEGEKDSEKKEALIAEKGDKITSARIRVEDAGNYLKQRFHEFTPGYGYAYPMYEGMDPVKAVFIGYKINEKLKNPWAPSAIKAIFALASNDQRIELPLSKDDKLSAAVAKSNWQFSGDEQEKILDVWDEIIKEKLAISRTTQYIVTGNILQAFAKDEFKTGKLVDYSLQGGGRKKGILLPMGFEPGGTGETSAMRVSVPIGKALPYIKSMKEGDSVQTAGKFSIIRTYDVEGRGPGGVFKIQTPKNKTNYGKYFLNTEIMKLTMEGEFAQYRGDMAATVKANNIDKLVNGLDKQFKETVEIPQSVFESIKGKMKVGDTEYTDEVVLTKTELEDLEKADGDFDTQKKLAETAEVRAVMERMKQDEQSLDLKNKIRIFTDLLAPARKANGNGKPGNGQMEKGDSIAKGDVVEYKYKIGDSVRVKTDSPLSIRGTTGIIYKLSFFKGFGTEYKAIPSYKIHIKELKSSGFPDWHVEEKDLEKLK